MSAATISSSKWKPSQSSERRGAPAMQSAVPVRKGTGLAAIRLAASELRIQDAKSLGTPEDLEIQVPLDEGGAEFVAEKRREIAAILSGRDDRLLVVVGPCSIHDSNAALDYAGRLADAAWAHSDDLLVVMRVYLEKPRTVLGWRGFINDPRLDGSFEMGEGLRLGRELMVRIMRLGLPVASEFLDTMLGQFYADLVSWGAIGARTVESQVHRDLASGLPMPIGFKNRTDGNVTVAVDAIRAARSAHWLASLSRDGTPTVVGTSGNDDGHLVLRGGTRGTNYSAAAVRSATRLLRKHRLPPHLIVDCSHGNSGRDPARQPAVASSLAARIREGDRAIAGVMMESNLVGGAQDSSRRPLVYGQSVTDPCLAWEDTVPVLADLALAVRARRLALEVSAPVRPARRR